MTKEVQRWADKAMFSAEPMTSQKPTVRLIWMTPDPLAAIAACAKMYKGEVCRDLSEITDEERIQYFEDGTKTVLGAPFENVQFHFLIEGVTRGFTHQLVRQRTATYFQESTRFAVIEESFADRVGLPPSLDGTIPLGEHSQALHDQSLDSEMNTSQTQRWRNQWDYALAILEGAYKALVNDGMPAEDARGLLPTNLLTRVHYRTNLRDLIGHAGNRLCTQAQFEWRYVFNAIISAIKTAEVVIRVYGAQADETPYTMRQPVYMRERLAELFKPVCYQRGTCGFQASFDRPCTIRDRVQNFADNGVSSDHWHERGWPTKEDRSVHLLPIFPAEWALDPTAARS